LHSSSSHDVYIQIGQGCRGKARPYNWADEADGKQALGGWKDVGQYRVGGTIVARRCEAVGMASGTARSTSITLFWGALRATTTRRISRYAPGGEFQGAARVVMAAMGLSSRRKSSEAVLRKCKGQAFF